MIVEFEIPTVVPSAANLREHWAARARRTKRLRTAAALVAGNSITRGLRAAVAKNGGTITLTRLSPRRLDDDNLAAALKPIRDGIADTLDMDDGSPLLTWAVAQEKGKPATVTVRIEVL